MKSQISLSGAIWILVSPQLRRETDMTIRFIDDEDPNRPMELIIGLIQYRMREVGQSDNAELFDTLWDHFTYKLPQFISEKGPEVPERLFKSFWWRVIYNRSIDYLRMIDRLQKRCPKVDLDAPISDDDTTSFAEVISDPLQKDFRTMLDTLRGEYLVCKIEEVLNEMDGDKAAIYRAHFFEGQGPTEIARLTGRNPKQMSIVLTRLGRSVHQAVFELLVEGDEIAKNSLCDSLKKLKPEERKIIIWRSFRGLSLRKLAEIFEGSETQKDSADISLHRALLELLFIFITTENYE